MDREADRAVAEPLLEVKKVGDVRKVEKPGQTRKRSGELKLKREKKIEEEERIDPEPMKEGEAVLGFERRSVSETRGINMTVELSTLPTPVQTVSALRSSPPSASSPVSKFLFENSNSSAGHPNGDRIDVCVFFANDPEGMLFCLENGRQAEAKYVLSLAAHQSRIDMKTAEEVFALWMVSPLLEVQLKPHNPPYEVRRQWANFIKKFSNPTDDQILNDEPMLMIRRSVTLRTDREKEICEKDPLVCRLLYEDARSQFLEGRYAFECRDAAHMAGLSIAAVHEKCPENALEVLRKEIEDHIPLRHLPSVRGPLVFGRALSGSREMEEVVLAAWREAGKGSEEGAMLSFIAHAQQSPCYGAAFFSGNIEKPDSSLRGIKSWFSSSNSDMQVRVGVNQDWICVADEAKGELLLAQPIADCTWRKIEPDERQVSEGAELSLLLHFPEDSDDPDRSSDDGKAKKEKKERRKKGKVVPRGPPRGNETNVLQIFGPQVVLMEALLNSMQILGSELPPGVRRTRSNSPDDGAYSNDSFEPSSASSNEGNSRKIGRQPSLTKGHRMCLATFNSEGRCLRAQGSLKKVLPVS